MGTGRARPDPVAGGREERGSVWCPLTCLGPEVCVLSLVCFWLWRSVALPERSAQAARGGLGGGGGAAGLGSGFSSRGSGLAYFLRFFGGGLGGVRGGYGGSGRGRGGAGVDLDGERLWCRGVAGGGVMGGE